MIHICFKIPIDAAVSFQGIVNFKCKISASEKKGISTVWFTILSDILRVSITPQFLLLQFLSTHGDFYLFKSEILIFKKISD